MPCVYAVENLIGRVCGCFGPYMEISGLPSAVTFVTRYFPRHLRIIPLKCQVLLARDIHHGTFDQIYDFTL